MARPVKLEAHYEKMGYRFEELLALPAPAAV